VSDELAGCRVLVTRERPGDLARMLAEHGAEVVHVPLIEVVEPDDDSELRRHLDRLDDFDWLIVTSAPGAERVAGAAAGAPTVRLAAVGSATASTLARQSGRDVDVVPTTQHAAALLDELLAVARPVPQRMLIAQADRAVRTLEQGLRAAGHDVTAVVAYRTELRTPPPGALDGADALLLASGSAAEAWVAAAGVDAPPIVVSIGPTTTATAERLGLKITTTATDHSLEGLVMELRRIRSVTESDNSRRVK
jgi:uroporphyrinogen-III synthase